MYHYDVVITFLTVGRGSGDSVALQNAVIGTVT